MHNICNNIHKKPKPYSNAALIGAIGILAFIGVIIPDDGYIKLSCLTLSCCASITCCTIIGTKFGDALVIDTLVEVSQWALNKPAAQERKD